MRSAAAQPRRAAPQAPDTPYLIFAIASQCYAVAVPLVIEIVRMPALTMLSGAPPHLCGLLNWHGQHLAVLDGRALVGQPSSYTLTSQVILIGPGGDHASAPQLGLLVDEVRRVVAPPPESVTPLVAAMAAPFLTAVIQEQDGSSTILIDGPALLALAPPIPRPHGREAHHAPTS
jgi:purine-binding chemotaxis protein CheW